jgi:dolichyl-diphosphooligosaccharide--protein glycosyltransferase
MAGNEQPSISQVTRDFLEDHPDGEQQLQSLLEVDAAEETWAFDDIPLDSGLFGEVVAPAARCHTPRWRCRAGPWPR